jgi:hypothetical protein
MLMVANDILLICRSEITINARPHIDTREYHRGECILRENCCRIVAEKTF